MKQIYIKQQPCVVEWGQFPTLISNNQKENGKLMSNHAKCKKAEGGEKYALQREERKVLKNVMKNTPKEKLNTICKGSGLIQSLVM